MKHVHYRLNSNSNLVEEVNGVDHLVCSIAMSLKPALTPLR